MRSARRARTILAALAVTAAAAVPGAVLTAPAAAATVDDADDGVTTSGGRQVDIRRVSVDQSGDQTTVTALIEQPGPNGPTAEADQVAVFFDTNSDGRSERGLVFEGFSDGSYTANLATTPSSLENCQRFAGAGPAYESGPVALGSPGADGLLTLQVTFPTSALGGATTFRWAAYGLTDDLTAATYDYLPDAANRRTPSSGTATGDDANDGCDHPNADGTYAGTGDERTKTDGSYPIDLAQGASFPGTSSPPPTNGGQPGGGGSPGGGSPGGVLGGADPLLPDPTLIAVRAPQYVRAAKMPDVRAGSRRCKRRLCTVAQAKSLLTRAGLRNYTLIERNGDIDDVPKSLKDRIEHGQVIGQTPAPGTTINELNLAAYPHIRPPTVRLLTYEDPKLRFRCDDSGIEKELVGKTWPGTTTGRGRNRQYGAQDLLRRLKCNYRLTYKKKSGVTEPTIEKADAGDRVTLRIATPRTVELAVFPDEGAYHPGLRGKNLVGLLPDRVMPTTGEGLGGFTVHVVQTTSAPSLPVAGVGVSVTDPTGAPSAVGKTGSDGVATLVGPFTREGRYTITALLEGENGLTLDGTGTLEVRKVRSPLTTQTGRRFRFRNDEWELLQPEGARAPKVRAAQGQAFGQCDPSRDPDTWAGYERSFMLDALEQLGAARTPEDAEKWTGVFLHHYLGSREAGLLERRILQDFLKQRKVSVLNVGAGTLKPVTNLCTIITATQARQLARGFDLKSAPLPVIELNGALGLPDGSFVPRTGFSPTGFVLAGEAPAPGQLQLSADERVLLLEAVISTGGGNVTADIRDALYGVISTGGGNVISTGVGNVISTGGLNLTARQRQALGRIISDNGASLRPEELSALNALISDKGLGLSPDAQLDAARGVISTGGGNLNADRLRVVQAVISTGGGNVISTGGGNVRDVLLPFVNGVISTGGGNLSARLGDLRNVQALIGQAGGNLIGQAGGNLIGQAGGNIISEAGGV